MSILYPDGVLALGNTAGVIVQTMANPAAPSLATDINASTSVNVSCMFMEGAEPTKEPAKNTRPRRWCTKKDVQSFGVVSYSVSDLVYIYDPQGASTTDGNKARAALVEGSTVYLVLRRGLPAQTTAFAAAQKVDVWKLTLGPQNKTTTGGDDTAEYTITQAVIVAPQGPWEDVAIAA